MQEPDRFRRFDFHEPFHLPLFSILTTITIPVDSPHWNVLIDRLHCGLTKTIGFRKDNL